MSTFRKLAGQVRWRWVLPFTMVGITAILLVQARFQYRAPNPTGGCDACGDMRPPAMVVAMLINGPVSFAAAQADLPPIRVFGEEIYGAGMLLPIFVFWLVIGLAVDRSHKGKTLLRSRWLRARLSVVGLLFCAVMGWWLMSDIGSWFWLDLKTFIHMLSLIGLWTADVSKVVQLPWCLFGIIYFACKLWRLYRSGPTAAQSTITN